MTSEQKVAYVNAKTARMLVELEGMKAENAIQTSTGNIPTYTESAFQLLFVRYEFLQPNNLVEFFEQNMVEFFEQKPAEEEPAKRVTRPGKGSERVSLRSVREALTQSEVAAFLEVDVDKIGCIERRLRKYAEAIGARCEVAFVFGDGRRVLIAESDAAPSELK